MGLKQPSPEDSSGFIIGGAICLGMALPLTYLSDTLLGFLWSSSGDDRSDFDMLLGALSAAIGVLLLARGIAGPPGDPDSPEGLARNRQVAFILFGIPAMIAAVVGGLSWLVPLGFSHHETLRVTVENFEDGSLSHGPGPWSVYAESKGTSRSTWGRETPAGSAFELTPSESGISTGEGKMDYPTFGLGVWSGEWNSVEVSIAIPHYNDAPTFTPNLQRCEGCSSQPINVSVRTAHPCLAVPNCYKVGKDNRVIDEPCEPEPNCFVQEAQFAKRADVVPVNFDFGGFPPLKPPLPL